MPRDGSRQKDARVDQGQRYCIGYGTLPASDPHAPPHRGHRRREQVREKGREQHEDTRTLNGSHHAGNTLQDRAVVTRATEPGMCASRFLTGARMARGIEWYRDVT